MFYKKCLVIHKKGEEAVIVLKLQIIAPGVARLIYTICILPKRALGPGRADTRGASLSKLHTLQTTPFVVVYDGKMIWALDQGWRKAVAISSVG